MASVSLLENRVGLWAPTLPFSPLYWEFHCAGRHEISGLVSYQCCGHTFAWITCALAGSKFGAVLDMITDRCGAWFPEIVL
jgi:hypothetical protein